MSAFIRPGTDSCQGQFSAPASGRTSHGRLAHEQDDGLLVRHRSPHPRDSTEVLLQPLNPVRCVYHRLDGYCFKKCIFCKCHNLEYVRYQLGNNAEYVNYEKVKVKYGQRYTLNSLRKCIAKYGSLLSTPYVLHDKDMKVENGIVYLPLYMTPLL